jgi:hypothetical protein
MQTSDRALGYLVKNKYYEGLRYAVFRILLLLLPARSKYFIMF